MKIGYYVRTKDDLDNQLIGKIDKIIGKFCISTDTGYWDMEHIIKSSPNIIDLIEVGDYVNGLKITSINEPSMANCNKRLLYAEDEEGYLIERFDEDDIKSIITKEQFEIMEYKINENTKIS